MTTRHASSCLAGVMLLAFAPAILADAFSFEARLTGAQEVVFDGDDNFVPGGVDTQAAGSARARFDRGLTNVFVSLRIRNLTGGFLAAHFHCGLPGQNGPIAFGLVMPGPLTFDGERVRGELTNTDFTGNDCVPIVGRPVNNIAALAQAMADGLVYINVHTDFAMGGEIRGQMFERDDDHRRNYDDDE